MSNYLYQELHYQKSLGQVEPDPDDVRPKPQEPEEPEPNDESEPKEEEYRVDLAQRHSNNC